jgi:hypothetical protein
VVPRRRNRHRPPQEAVTLGLTRIAGTASDEPTSFVFQNATRTSISLVPADSDAALKPTSHMTVRDWLFVVIPTFVERCDECEVETNHELGHYL